MVKIVGEITQVLVNILSKCFFLLPVMHPINSWRSRNMFKESGSKTSLMCYVAFAASFFMGSIDAHIRMEIRTEDGIKNEVVVGKPFTLDVVIDNVQGSVNPPKIKGLENSKCSLSGAYSSNINGKSTARYSYNIRIDTLGVHTIGPAIVQHQQQELISNSLQIAVVKDPGIAAQKNTSSTNAPAKAFLRLMTDTQSPFVGQKMDCALRFYYQDPSISLQAVTIPELLGFDIKDLSNPETGTAEIDGAQYSYIQWRWSLYPTKPGEFIIPAYSADYDVPIKDPSNHFMGGFFMFMTNRADRKRVYSNTVNIKVSPLPLYDGDVDAVGVFERITADIKPGVAKEGEGMVLAIELEGVGNLSAIAMPKLVMPDALKYYESNSSIIPARYNDELPKKRFEFIVQALKEGDYEIPEQQFTYFDVERNSYITLRTCALAVSIMPGVSSVRKDNQSHPLDGLADGHADNQLKDINTSGPWYPIAERKPLPWWLFELLFLLPCLYILYPFAKKRFIAFTDSSVRLSRRRAFKQARKRIDICIKNNNNAELYSIFMALLSQGNSITQDNSTIIVQKLCLSPEQINEWNLFYESIMHAAYAQSDISNDNTLGIKAKQWLEILEKNI